MELGIKIAMGFKNKESLENLRHTKKFVFYLLKLKNATKPFLNIRNKTELKFVSRQLKERILLIHFH